MRAVRGKRNNVFAGDSISQQAAGRLEAWPRKSVVGTRVFSGSSPQVPWGKERMEKVVHRHRALYKGCRAPPWKETFRQRCVERLKNSRARLLDRYRQAGLRDVCQAKEALLVQEVMEIEWKALQDMDVQMPPLRREATVPQMLEDSTDLSDLEEIQQELILQERLAIEEYERMWKFDQECLTAMLDGLEAGCRIICPVCRRNVLRVTDQLVECPCGLRISVQGLSEDKLRMLLEESVTEHGHACQCPPEFTLMDGVEGEHQLLLSCQACDFLAVIL